MNLLRRIFRRTRPIAAPEAPIFSALVAELGDPFSEDF